MYPYIFLLAPLHFFFEISKLPKFHNRKSEEKKTFQNILSTCVGKPVPAGSFQLLQVTIQKVQLVMITTHNTHDC